MEYYEQILWLQNDVFPANNVINEKNRTEKVQINKGLHRIDRFYKKISEPVERMMMDYSIVASPKFEFDIHINIIAM